MARLGQLNTWTIGVVAYLTHTVPMALATRSWHIYATLPSHVAIMHRVSVERVMVATAGAPRRPYIHVLTPLQHTVLRL